MQATSTRAFQLNTAFDVSFLMEMHDSDLSAISAILVTSSQQIAEELDRYMILAQKGDCSELKRRVHLVKPLWGYCGLPQMQMKYQLLEHFLEENPPLEKMLYRLQQEHDQIQEGINLINQEALRIHEYLKQPAS
ncbi:hypothetical protein [Flavihumibacter petaseus]|uniref:HPt domain-containing protein n=1 Tax=Flavihumibacter petaseus NBRC 106054 TaxID=1220578 RepID=A0A0E9N5Z7_9BACT|nr:hypothetical protein [Flavihumibacter petaseus]GAO44775.1 hypothetical protein FPE01S_04_00180 [Flavihumibacter petaseus NBRC 106054]